MTLSVGPSGFLVGGRLFSHCLADLTSRDPWDTVFPEEDPAGVRTRSLSTAKGAGSPQAVALGAARKLRSVFPRRHSWSRDRGQEDAGAAPVPEVLRSASPERKKPRRAKRLQESV